MDIVCISLVDNCLKLQLYDKVLIIKEKKKIEAFFKRLSEVDVVKYSVHNNGNVASIQFKNYAFRIYNYKLIRKLHAFESLKKKLNYFRAQMIFNNLKGKNFIVIGSIVGTVALSCLYGANQLSNIDEDQSISIETTDIDLDDDLFESVNFDYPNTDENQFTNSGDKVNAYEGNQENCYVNFDSLKDFNSDEQYIKFAADLYGVPLDVATKQVKDNYDSFSTPGKKVDEHSARELDRMKDLVSRGFINGDMNVIGIFLTIKDYAIDEMNLSQQPAILSNKSPEEREKDVVNIAKYIYGVDDPYMLSVMVATMRVESQSGKSDAAKNKNNIGGNMSSKGTFENPVLNVYKTAEIGEESFVRNFLNCYGKSLVAYNYDDSIPLPMLMKDKFCPHTPEEWGNTISEITDKVMSEGIVDSYLDITSTKR